MRGAGVLLAIFLLACGGVVDDPGGVESALGKKDGGCSDAPPAGPVCTAPKKYALLFKGQPKPKAFSTDGSGEDANDMVDNINQMGAALLARGYEVSYAGAYDELTSAINTLAKKVRCCDDVFFYYTGHGGHKKGNPKSDFGYLDMQGQMHYLAVDPTVPLNGAQYQPKQLDARQLALMLSKLKTCHLHILIDACYSGGFVDALAGTLPGAESIQTSASSTEPAWSGNVDQAQAKKDDGTFENPPRMVTDPYGRAQGEKGSEFSSGYVEGLKGAPRGDGGEALAQAGFNGAITRDVTALAKWTHPVNRQRQGDCICDNHGDPWIPMCAPSPEPSEVPVIAPVPLPSERPAPGGG
jgi:Caspase domain